VCRGLQYRRLDHPLQGRDGTSSWVGIRERLPAKTHRPQFNLNFSQWLNRYYRVCIFEAYNFLEIASVAEARVLVGTIAPSTLAIAGVAFASILFMMTLVARQGSSGIQPHLLKYSSDDAQRVQSPSHHNPIPGGSSQLSSHQPIRLFMSKLILVSNRLPVRVKSDGTPQRTTGGLASALAAVETDAPQYWVGWSGTPLENTPDPDSLRKTMSELKIVPVFLTADEIDGFYEGYSNGTLWPLLHYMTQKAHFKNDWADHYRRANEKFADAILEIAEDGDTVWVHDYHLFLLPGILRERKPNLKIGFFLHTPFPSSEIFRVLPEREEILKGLLGADLLGFHTYNYLRHFRSSLLHLLGLESDIDHLYLEGRRPTFGVFPIGHNHKGFHDAMAHPGYRETHQEMAESLNGRKLILSVERLDYTKGVPQKLEAIRHFLTNYPQHRGKVVFAIIAVPSRESVDEYADLTETVQREVGAINGEFGTMDLAPINFLHRGFPPHELAAFYSLADSCLVTPLIDGMNLVAKEYVDCKRKKFKARPGVLILSEFAGAAPEMPHALRVNPYSVSEVASAIDQALTMPEAEMWGRTRAMQDHIVKNDAGAWANRFLSHLENQTCDLNEEKGVSDLSTLLDSFKVDGAKALFLDYDGTLRGFENKPEDAIPDPGLLPLLKRLGKHLRIVIVSGRPKEFLEEHFSGHNFTLVAEHGYRWSRAHSPEWDLVNPLVDISWKEDVLPHLEQATQLTPGTHIETKPSALVWHYRSADPEFGLWQAHRLLSELTESTASLPVAVHHGKKIVEVASQQVSKGAAVEALLHDWDCQTALAVGDDQTDETMFSIETKTPNYHTIHIGGSDTRALHLSDIPHFRNFLETLADSLEA
jgi:trehalose 6-phosphate synthase/phosphatase